MIINNAQENDETGFEGARVSFMQYETTAQVLPVLNVTQTYSQVPNKRGVPIIRGLEKLPKLDKRGGGPEF